MGTPRLCVDHKLSTPVLFISDCWSICCLICREPSNYDYYYNIKSLEILYSSYKYKVKVKVIRISSMSNLVELRAGPHLGAQPLSWRVNKTWKKPPGQAGEGALLFCLSLSDCIVGQHHQCNHSNWGQQQHSLTRRFLLVHTSCRSESSFNELGRLDKLLLHQKPIHASWKTWIHSVKQQTCQNHHLSLSSAASSMSLTCLRPPNMARLCFKVSEKQRDRKFVINCLPSVVGIMN